MNPTIPCPSCGHAVQLIAALNQSQHLINTQFQCGNCHNHFTGLLTLGTFAPGGGQCYAAIAPDKADKKKWFGIGFDGALATRKSNGGLGEPIAETVARIKQWQKDGFAVRIFSERAADAMEVLDIQAWLRRHGLPKLEVTNLRDADMLELWDERVVRVDPCSGKPCSGCQPPKGNHGLLSESRPQYRTNRFDSRGNFLTDC